MYQKSGIHPACSNEKYQPLDIRPGAVEHRVCKGDDLARSSKQGATSAAVAATAAQEAAAVATPPPTTSAQSPIQAASKPVLPPASIPPVGLSGRDAQQGGPGPSVIGSAVDTRSDMDKELVELLAASSTAGRSSIGQRSEVRKATVHSSPGVTLPKRQGAAGSQAANRTPPAKGNVRNAKAALEDWLDL
jgi:hypothetical protein